MATDHGQKSQARLAAIVIVVAMLLWMGVSFLGGQYGLPTQYAFLADLAALAAFAFAIIVLIRVWRERQADKDD